MAERAHLRLEEFSDPELLLALDDVCAAGEGWGSARQVAKHIGLDGEEPHRPVANRLSWQQRFGSVEREFLRDEAGNIRYHRDGKPMYTQNWRLSDIGRQLAYGRLRKADETALGRLDDGQMLVVTRWLTQRTLANGASPVTSKLVQREWKYNMAQARR
jgi:hypothetical protein